MTKREREQTRLKAGGYDGLYHPDPIVECGCFIHDLYPCGDRPQECRPGHQREVMGIVGIFEPTSKRNNNET